MNADRTGFAHQLVHHRAVQDLEPARPVAFADDDLGDVVRLGIGDDFLGDVAAGDRDRRSAEPLGEPQVLGDPVALGIIEAICPGCLDIDRSPRRVQAVGDAPGIADQALRSPAAHGPAIACACICDNS